MLKQTKRTLESRPSDWILVIDGAQNTTSAGPWNAENVTLVNYLPCCGRTLVTTRDTKFTADLPVAATMMQVEAMTEQEALCLLSNAIPKSVRVDEKDRFTENGTVFVKGLGFRPLTITHAAANVRMLHMSLKNYLRLFRIKQRQIKCHIGSQCPEIDLPQSLLATLEISLDLLCDSNCLSVTLLYFMAVFHSQDLPVSLLRFVDYVPFGKEHIDHNRAVEKMQSLSLVERRSGNASCLWMQSIVSCWLSSGLQRDRRLHFVTRAVENLAIYFPLREEKLDRDEGRELLPHALQLIKHAFALRVVSMPFVRLLYIVSSFLNAEGMNRRAAELLSPALPMAIALWSPTSMFIVHVKAAIADSCNQDGKFRQAETELKDALSRTDTAEAPEIVKMTTRIRLKEALTEALFQQEKFDEEEVLHRELQELEQEKGNVHYFRRMMCMAKCLMKRNKLDEAFGYSTTVINWLKKERKCHDAPYFSWLVVHAELLDKRGSKVEAYAAYSEVLESALDVADPTDDLIWKLGRSIANVLLELCRYDEHEALTIRLLRTTDGPRLQEEALLDFSRLLALLGSNFLNRNRLVEAEQLYLRAAELVEYMKLDPRLEDPIPSYRYNVLLCLTRQGKLEETRDFHERYREEIEAVERSSGRTVADWMRLDQEVLDTYNTGLEKLREGATIEDDKWFEENRDVLETAGDRYGLLEDRLREGTEPATDMDSNGLGVAKRSTILKLLGLYYISDEDVLRRRLEQPQTLITDFFRFCKCYRYSRRCNARNEHYG